MSLDKLLRITDKLDKIFPPEISRKELINTVSNRVADKYENRLQRLFAEGWLSLMKEHSFRSKKDITQKEDIRRYAEQYAGDMAPDFSPSFFFAFKYLSRYAYFPRLVSSLNFSEEGDITDSIKRLNVNHPVLLLPNHVSNADHLPICFALNNKGLKQPIIAAGANLYYGSSAKLLPKLNAYKLRRDEMKPSVPWLSNPVYKQTHKEFLRYVWDNNQLMMFYIEGSRSRDGHLQDPKVGILREYIDYIKRGNVGYIALAGISYTSVYEDTMLEQSRQGEKISDENLIKQLKKMDENYKNFMTPAINVHFQDIIELTPQKVKKKKLRGIRDEIMEGIGEGVRPTPTYVVSDSILRLNKDSFTRNELVNMRYEDMRSPYNTLFPSKNKVLRHINQEVDIALDVFTKKGFISANDEYRIENKTLIEQYANRIAHQK